MKTGIHPALHKTKVTCSCGASYEINGTLETLSVEICMACHPHYTGKKKLVDSEGRVDKFMKKFKQKEPANDNVKKTKKEASAEKMAA